jgi:hypothetical protein
VQRWLGHQSPAFTLATYVHLMDDQLGEPIDLGAELQGGNRMATDGSALAGASPQSANGNLPQNGHKSDVLAPVGTSGQQS